MCIHQWYPRVFNRKLNLLSWNIQRIYRYSSNSNAYSLVTYTRIPVYMFILVNFVRSDLTDSTVLEFVLTQKGRHTSYNREKCSTLNSPQMCVWWRLGGILGADFVMLTSRIPRAGGFLAVGSLFSGMFSFPALRTSLARAIFRFVGTGDGFLRFADWWKDEDSRDKRSSWRGAWKGLRNSLRSLAGFSFSSPMTAMETAEERTCVRCLPRTRTER